MKLKISNIKSIYALIAVLPWLAVYQIGPFDLGELVMLFISTICVFFAGFGKYGIVKNEYWPYFIWVIISFVIHFYMSNNIIYSKFFIDCIREIYIAFNIIILGYYFLDLDMLFNNIMKIGIISCVCFYIQLIEYSLFNRVQSFFLPFLKLNYADGINSENYLALYSRNGFRPCSLFLEVSDYSKYMGLLLVFLFFYDKKMTKKRCILIIFITLSVIISGSLSGICYVALSYGMILLGFANKKTSKRGLLYLFLFVLLGIIFVVTQREMLIRVISRISEIRNIETTDSGYLRVLRGYNLFSDFSLPKKILGIGIENIININNNIGVYSEYMSGMSKILIGYGIIGIVLFLRVLYKGIRHGNIFQRTITYFLILLLISSNSYFSQMYVMLMTLITNRKLFIDTFKANEDETDRGERRYGDKIECLDSSI